MNILKTFVLAAILGSAGFLALAPTSAATHCDPLTDVPCIPHGAGFCIDNTCVKIRRPTSCTLYPDQIPPVSCQY